MFLRMQTKMFKRRATLLICPSSVQDDSFKYKTCSRGSTNIGKWIVSGANSLQLENSGNSGKYLTWEMF